MRYLLTLAPVLLLLAACQDSPPAYDTAGNNPATPPTAEIAAPPATPPVPVPVPAANPEYIEWSALTVNGQPHTALSTKRLTSQLGRPDSIAKGAVECGGELDRVNNANGDFWYYGKTAYEVAGPQAVLASFDVRTGKFRGRLGKLALDQNTTLEDVRRFFPHSAKGADVPATGRPGEVMSLPFFSDGKPLDASLNLIFKQGHLQEVEFWYPC